MTDLLRNLRVHLLIFAALAALLVATAFYGGGGPSRDDARSMEKLELKSHNNSHPPRCRPAGKYGGNPHPNDPACKHKPGKQKPGKQKNR